MLGFFSPATSRKIILNAHIFKGVFVQMRDPLREDPTLDKRRPFKVATIWRVLVTRTHYKIRSVFHHATQYQLKDRTSSSLWAMQSVLKTIWRCLPNFRWNRNIQYVSLQWKGDWIIPSTNATVPRAWCFTHNTTVLFCNRTGIICSMGLALSLSDQKFKWLMPSEQLPVRETAIPFK